MMAKERDLTREEMKSVIEGRGAAYRTPLVIHTWVHPEAFGKDAPVCEGILQKYPNDAEIIGMPMPTVFRSEATTPGYSWLPYENPFPEGTPLDAVTAISDWNQLPEIMTAFPSPMAGVIDSKTPAPGEKYRVAHFWYWLFERLWSLRGMENALCDFYDYPEEVHTLFRHLTDFYKALAWRAKTELGADALWTSDDIGTQKGPFFSPAIFREFFKPYYKELVDYCHSIGMHFWYHCCGNIIPFLPDLVEIGVDVLHPIQKYTMDEKEIAANFQKDICIWAGFDVQQIIPYGTEEEVRAEVDYLLHTYHRQDGRLILGVGNGITADTKLSCLDALFDQALKNSK